MKAERTSRIWRTISLLVALCMTLNASVAHAQYSGGSGTADDPYQIATAADLIMLGKIPHDYDKHFILTADIDLDPNLPGRKVFDTAVIASNSFTGDWWEYDGVPFTGVFDGNGHVISRLTFNRIAYLGLFGQVDPGGTICNLGVEDIRVFAISGYVGGLAAANNGGTIRNCYTTGYVEAKMLGGGLVGHNISGRIQDCHSSVDILVSIGAGGLVGRNESGTILNCYSTSNITMGAGAGGLVGSNTGFIGNCHSAGTVANGSDTGGLVGTNETGVIWNCYSRTPVTHGGDRVGGLVGCNEAESLILGCHSDSTTDGLQFVGGLVGYNDGGVVSMCSAQGSVVGDKYVGGLVGYSERAMNTLGPAREAWLSNCYSSASVTGTEYLGGLAGGSAGGVVINCYSNGQVTGVTNVGGLMGYCYQAYDDLVFAFWDIDRSGQSASAAGTGLTTAQMQDPNTYRSAGWDFVDSWADGTSNVWLMPTDGGYPLLAGPDEYVWPQLQGDGTAENPYLVHDAAELGAVCHYPPLAHYRLARSIDLSGISWGTAVVPFFFGVFDGNDLSISNLAATGTVCVGLFGGLGSGAEVENLDIVDANIAGTSMAIGGIAGWNCGHISACSVSGAVSGQNTVGGIVGRNDGPGAIVNCRNDSSVTGGDHIGGVAGFNRSMSGFQTYFPGTISGSCNFGAVENTGLYAGGIVGTNDSGTVSNSYNAGPVCGNHGGGLTGWNTWGNLINCYNIGLLQGVGQYSIDALVGPRCGGRSGGGGSGGPITSCFWDITSSGQPHSNYGIGSETADMKTAGTFLEAGWDFIGETANGTEDVWWIDEGNDYPRLWWEVLEQ